MRPYGQWPKRGFGRVLGGAQQDKCPQLMPALYSPYALWALDFTDSDAAGLVDRSGNARHLAYASGTKYAPQLREQRTGRMGTGTKLTQGTLGVGNTWELTGELTCCLRAWYDGDTTRTQVAFQANFYPYAASPVRNVPFTLYANTGTGALGSYSQHGSNVADQWTSTLVPNAGQWVFLTYRRALTGVITIGIDQTYQSSPALSLPGSAQGVQLAVFEANDGIAPLWWGGGIEDLGVWNVRLTDAQLVPLYKKAMGIYP